MCRTRWNEWPNKRETCSASQSSALPTHLRRQSLDYQLAWSSRFKRSDESTWQLVETVDHGVDLFESPFLE